MTQVSSCGDAQCAIIKGVLFCLMDLSKFQYLENEYLESSRALVEPQSAATSRVDRLTGNDLRYPQIDIAILCDLRLTSLLSGKPIEPRPARKYNVGKVLFTSE
ncbi:hypothetical protein ALC60_14297 [Trachymyrmex zeteki]|uniref:Uncharacterized protein n=1 Tax=Mycetomoellerius zeteki TaxID=64791 RepID=A0A151WG06_9HYME|nr:hypothetical protein ALC60_14297 [Trachymyrmex zeteki]